MFIDWASVVVSMVGTTIATATSIGIVINRNRREAKREGDAKHEQNTRKFDELLAERRFYPPHGHHERTGPLMAENITRPPEW